MREPRVKLCSAAPPATSSPKPRPTTFPSNPSRSASRQRTIPSREGKGSTDSASQAAQSQGRRPEEKGLFARPVGGAPPVVEGRGVVGHFSAATVEAPEELQHAAAALLRAEGVRRLRHGPQLDGVHEGRPIPGPLDEAHRELLMRRGVLHQHLDQRRPVDAAPGERRPAHTSNTRSRRNVPRPVNPVAPLRPARRAYRSIKSGAEHARSGCAAARRLRIDGSNTDVEDGRAVLAVVVPIQEGQPHQVFAWSGREQRRRS